MLDKTFTAEITKDKNSNWTCVPWDKSAEFFGTGKPVKVRAAIKGHEFEATFLPTGNKSHMLPIRAAVMKAIDGQLGETVDVHLLARF